MTSRLSGPDYEALVAATRDQRMAWWRSARFGMFVHFGLYALLGRMEWAMALENYSLSEYEALADRFQPKPGAARDWARLARAAGMRYMVLTTRHHDGFSLWDSAANPYNSVNLGPRRDLVREFVDACHECDLKVGFYSSLMDWHHPDSWRCAFDPEARQRFTDYIKALNRELLSQYGKIDVLWYDMPEPLEHAEGWDALGLNQMARALQPDIIINNRSRLPEDFDTPEERLTASERDWEACMTFNGLSWGYVDSEQARPYSYNAHGILRMLQRVTASGGNLLLNIGPRPDGSVPKEAREPLSQVGQWLQAHGEAVYGNKEAALSLVHHALNGVCTATLDQSVLYLWNWVWPADRELTLGGLLTPLRRASLLADGTDIPFRQGGHRVTLGPLPARAPDPLNVTVIKLEFPEPPRWVQASQYPQLHRGRRIQ
jgi:alpha-L-fucosidase